MHYMSDIVEPDQHVADGPHSYRDDRRGTDRFSLAVHEPSRAAS
jgi:hypothetical protein